MFIVLKGGSPFPKYTWGFSLSLSCSLLLSSRFFLFCSQNGRTSLWSQNTGCSTVSQAHTNGVHTRGGGRKERGLVLLRRWDGWVVGGQLLDGSFTVHTVVGLVVSHTVLFIQQVCCLVRQTVMQLRKSQFDFSVFTVRGLRCFVHPGCHQGILVLLSGDLLRAREEGTKRASHILCLRWTQKENEVPCTLQPRFTWHQLHCSKTPLCRDLFLCREFLNQISISF